MGYGYQSCSWSVEQGKRKILLPFVPENLVSRDRFDRPVPRHPAHSRCSGWTWCLLTRFLPFFATASTHPVNRRWVSLEFIGSLATTVYRWRSPPKVRWYRASNSQSSSSNNGCCLFKFHHGPTFLRLSFPTLTTAGMEWICVIQKVSDTVVRLHVRDKKKCMGIPTPCGHHWRRLLQVVVFFEAHYLQRKNDVTQTSRVIVGT